MVFCGDGSLEVSLADLLPVGDAFFTAVAFGRDVLGEDLASAGRGDFAAAFGGDLTSADLVTPAVSGDPAPEADDLLVFLKRQSNLVIM